MRLQQDYLKRQEKLSKAQANSDADGRTAESLKTRSDYNKADYDAAKASYDSALQEFSQLTGMTFNYTDETESTTDNQINTTNITGWTN